MGLADVAKRGYRLEGDELRRMRARKWQPCPQCGGAVYRLYGFDWSYAGFPHKFVCGHPAGTRTTTDAARSASRPETGGVKEVPA